MLSLGFSLPNHLSLGEAYENNSSYRQLLILSQI